jgi:signal transduction histidine kinase
VLVLAAAYYGTGHASLALQYTGPVTAIWLPVGVGVATLYLAGLRWLPGVIVGDLALGDYSLPLQTVLGFTVGNVADILVIALLLRRLLGPRAALDELRQVGWMLVAIAAGAAITATVAILSLRAGSAVEASDIPELWRSWFLADGSGALLVIPLALAWAQPLQRPSRSRAVEAALTLLAVVALSTVAFAGDLLPTYIVFPAFVWAALRFEVQGATLAVAVAALMTVGLTANEVGPFVEQSITGSVLSTQLYVAVAALTTLSLAAIVAERRRASAEARRLAEEQAALRRVATLVARGGSAEDEFELVAEELARLVGVDLASMLRFDPDDMVTPVAAWARDGAYPVPLDPSMPLDGLSTAALIRREGRPARVDDYTEATGPIAAMLVEHGIRSTVGSPIIVDGRVWGAMILASTRAGPPPPGTEERLASVTELVSTAIANAHAGAQVRRLADEQAALRRVATLVAHESSAATLLAAVADEVAAVLDADLTRILRYEPDGTATVVAAWGEPDLYPLDTRLTPDGGSVLARVLRTARSARVDSYAETPGAVAAELREHGVRSSVGAPIMADGRLWGVVIAATEREDPLPPESESRIAEFTELVATAIANAHSRQELAASRARVVRAGDLERRRIERNLHDGAQQRLVSIGLNLRLAASTVSDPELAGRLTEVGDGLTGVLEDLQEISRGLHPTLLATGGLEPALAALARRSAIPVELEVGVERRLSDAVEVAAYYATSEALANAAKHARASVVRVEAGLRDGSLSLRIHDDGVGGADPARGSGLIGLRDRIEAAGGRIEVVSPPGEGTTLRVTLPAG